MHKFKYIIILHRGVTHYDFCKFATILQVATIIFYYYFFLLLFLEIVSILETEFRGSFKDLKDQILNLKSHPEIMLTSYAYSLTREKR